MARIETWYKQDLKKPVPVRRLETVFNQDALGHLFGVEVYDNGQPVALAGSVNGYCLLADGTTVPVLGTRTENKAYIVLPQTAYNVLGPITITVKLTEGTAITTLLAVVGVVARSRSGQQVNPGSTITDWTNQIADALQDVEDASAAQDAKISDLKAAIYYDLGYQVQLLVAAYKTTGKYYLRGKGHTTGDNDLLSIFPAIPVKKGVTYYYKNLNAFYSKVYYDANTYEQLSNKAGSNQSGSFTPAQDGLAYISALTANVGVSAMLSNQPVASVAYYEGFAFIGDTNKFVTDIKHGIASDFSDAVIYKAGEYVWYGNELRIFTKDHPAGAWTDDTASVSTYRGLSEDVANIAYGLAKEYDDSETYNVGDYCKLNNRTFYVCNTQITTPEPFTSAHWTRIIFSDLIKQLKSEIQTVVLTSDPELNRIIKRLYIPSSVGLDLSVVNRVTVYNGGANLYGFRFFNKSNQNVFSFAKLNEVGMTGLWRIGQSYADIGDLTLIDGTSKNYYCTVYPAVFEDTKLADDYEKSLNTDNNSAISYSPVESSATNENKGDVLKVMSYNVAHYTNDVPSDIIPDEKIRNIIDVISGENADIICVQEDSGYIDSNNIRETQSYLYSPQYPYTTGMLETTVRSKRATNGEKGRLTYSNGRYLGYAVFEIGTKKVLVCSTHPSASHNGTGVDSQESIAARLTQYTEMFNWINGTVDLVDESTGNQVHVPEHTHVIIGMDANCATDTDKTNLMNLVNQNHYSAANGSRLGWLATCKSSGKWVSIDNVLVSENVIINSVKSLSSKFTNLYSDHVPLVINVTLT